jgi:hypothetical protein
MRGYPLDTVEKDALEHALHEFERSQSNEPSATARAAS